MKKKVLYTLRQALIAVIALQFLNLSVGSQTFWDDNDYDYSYSYNKTYDPTESAIELIVEMKYGQQPAFSYDNHADTNKNTSKALHWKTDLRETLLPATYTPIRKSIRIEISTRLTPSPSAEILSPPPESFPA
jgi:hypothetical protein